VSRKSRTKMPQVAILLETSHGVSRAMFQGILDYVRVYGPWSLNVVEGGANDQRVPDTRLWKGDGIIARVPNDKAARDIIASRLPAVIFNPKDSYLTPGHPLSRCCRIQFDSHAIGTLAAEYCLGRGLSHFAFVGHPHNINWSRWRQEAFVARLAEKGRDCHLYPPPPPKKRAWDSERPRLCAWLRSLPKPVSLFAANDNRGRQVLDACLVAGIGVPYEATVLGVNNDILICETCIPPLSSIVLDDAKAGYEAAHLLDLLMQRKEKPGRVVRYGPKEIVSRASTDVLQLSDKRVISALEFIRINSGINIRVSDVAAHLGVTGRWAESRFKQALGRSLHQEIHEQCMATAYKMVIGTNQPLEEIARRCGFRSVNHLCRIFKKAHGCTMGSLRNNPPAT